MSVLKPFYELKRIISQFFETEYWYRFRRIPYKYYDDFGKNPTYKYIWNKVPARDHLTCTWDGEGDIINIMLLKIEHQFHNLKRYGVHRDFYFNSWDIIENGTKEDKLWAFNKIIEENKHKNVKPKDRKYNLNIDGNKINFYIGDGKRLVLELDPESIDNNYYYWYIEEKGKEEIQVIPNRNNVEDWIVEGVIYNYHTVDIDVKEFKNISDGLKPFARGNRRTLTDLLHLRHMLNKLYNLDDTNDKYTNMWENEKDDDKRQTLLRQAGEQYMADRKRLYHEIAEFMAEKGRGWWD